VVAGSTEELLQRELKGVSSRSPQSGTNHLQRHGEPPYVQPGESYDRPAFVAPDPAARGLAPR